MIKAIETKYKGYKFRSRLEARWAVFFDALGVQWEYEKEGYDLGDAGYYLPDFWLPETKSYLEIKPLDCAPNAVEKVYFAGKFSGSSTKNGSVDWRSEFGVDPTDAIHDAGDYMHTLVGHFYVGPAQKDLSSGHGSEPGHIVDFYDEEGSAGLYLDSDRREVFANCRSQIAMCDTLFAWIYDDTCYGTLVEIGYAAALGKRIWVGIDDSFAEKVGDMWFSMAAAETVVTAPSAIEAFYKLCPMRKEESSMHALIKGEQSDVECGAIVYGDPKEHKVSLFFRDEKWMRSMGYGEKSPVHSGYNWDALRVILPKTVSVDRGEAENTARSARFEHGETPRLYPSR